MKKTKEHAYAYVGGKWEEAGKRQLDLLVKEGMKPDHILLEIGCGCARAGKYFIKYLDKGRYIGIDHHSWLVKVGRDELGEDLMEEKKPFFIIDDNFTFLPNVTIDFAIAKSVFTHLTKERIKQCLKNLAPILGGAFYTSIWVGDSSKNPKEDHDNQRFSYTVDEIKELAPGWNIEVLDHEGCYKQTMLKLTKKL